MTYLIANARLMQGDANAALKSYEEYLKNFPKGDYAVECSYRIGLCLMFTNKYEDAMHKFEAFVKDNPAANSRPDARYRLLVVKYAAQLYDEVVADANRLGKSLSRQPDHRRSARAEGRRAGRHSTKRRRPRRRTSPLTRRRRPTRC